MSFKNTLQLEVFNSKCNVIIIIIIIIIIITNYCINGRASSVLVTILNAMCK